MAFHFAFESRRLAGQTALPYVARLSIEQSDMDVRTMDGGMTSGSPAGAQGDTGRMISAPDEDSIGYRPLNLAVTAQTQIRIRNGQHFGVDGSVRSVAGSAAFA